MTSPLVVVDTNVLVAGLLTRDATAPTARIVDAMLRGAIRFLLSEELLSEYRSVLLRPAIARAHALSAEEVDEILIRLAANGTVRLAAEARAGAADDAHLVALLDQEAGARLVSGDAAALRRADRRGLSPRAFADERSG